MLTSCTRILLLVSLAVAAGCADRATAVKGDYDADAFDWWVVNDAERDDAGDAADPDDGADTADDGNETEAPEGPNPCDDGLACTIDRSVQGSCFYEPAEGSCFIEGRCFAAGDRDPTRPCFVCAPDVDSRAFKPAPAQRACNDADPCTVEDACTTDGRCVGRPKSCDDGIGCTFDACVVETGGASGTSRCTHEPSDAFCRQRRPGSFCAPSGAGDPQNPQPGCADGVCRAGERVCTDDGGAWRTCNAQGSGFVENAPVDCPAAQPFCIAGRCTACRPSDTRCESGFLTRCTQGGTWAAPEACPESAPSCIDGRCTACTPGETTCVENELRRCSDAGEWAVVETCAGETPICNTDAGRCTACETGAVDCAFGRARECSATGDWDIREDCTALADRNVCLNGFCVACAPASTRCAGNRLDTCSLDGAWVSGPTCAGGCTNGRCNTCTPGTTTCEGNTPVTCNNAGEPVRGAPCSDATPTCSNGACVVCVEGTQDCLGKLPRRCLGGRWEKQTECVGERPYCYDGTCVLCTPNQRQCDLNTVQTCDFAGQRWVSGTACAEPRRCDPATGTCIDRGANHAVRYPFVSGNSAMTGSVRVADADNLTLTGPFTLEAWVYPEAVRSGTNCVTSGHIIIEKWTSGGGTPPKGEYILYLCSKRNGSAATNSDTIGDLRFGVMAENAVGEIIQNYSNFDDVIYPGRWYHIAAAAGPTELRLYMNGQLMTKAASGADYFRHSAARVALNEPIQFGRLDQFTVYSFQGIIDEVRISRGVRYPDVFNPAIYLEADADTLGLWHFDEGSGAACGDTSSNNRDAVFTPGNGVEWTARGVPE